MEKKMKKQSIWLVTFVVMFAMIFAACKSPSSSGYDSAEANGNGMTMEDIKVPKNFNWKTFATYDITLEAEEAGQFQVVSESGTVYHRANLNGKDAYTFNLAIPTYEDKVKVQFRGESMLLDLSSKSLFHSFEGKGAAKLNRGIIASGR